EPVTKASWTRQFKALSKARMEGVARFPMNPEENWGPKARAGNGTKRSADAMDGGPSAKHPRGS
ncbi:hypothetical protein CYMTET_21726, partial [Cymbomonas tetramitiformis]